MSSDDDLFRSYSPKKTDVFNSTGDLFSESYIEPIRVKGKRKEKQQDIVPGVSGFIPDFSSYERHNLIVESDVSHPTVSLTDQMPKHNQENITQSDHIPDSVVVEPKDHMIGGCPPVAFCSTPGPMNGFASSSLKVDGTVAPKTVSGDLLNALQVTPIHPVFTNENKSPACEMEKTLSHLDYHLKDTPLQHNSNNNDNHNNATHYSLSLPNREVVVRLTALDFSNLPPQLSQHSPSDEHRQNCQQQECQFQSPGLSRSIGAGKKSSTYTKRLTRHFRHENMILNRSYMELFGAGDAKGALLKICGQTDYKTFTQLFVPARRKSLKKIGEGCFGEVFRCPAEDCRSKHVVMKFIPIEGDVKFNGEPQKSFDEVLSEVIVSKELTALGMGFSNCTSGFVELIRVHLLRGAFPLYLRKSWEEYDRVKGSENDHPKIFPKDQLWVVLESAFCGVPLENNIPPCPCARVSLLLQVGFSLAVAEEELKFEHRDLHWGNILISEGYVPPANKSAMPCLSSTSLSSSSSSSFSRSLSSLSSTSLKDCCCKYCSHLENIDEADDESDKENKKDVDDRELDHNNRRYVQFRLNNQVINVPRCGSTAYLIDFTMSRLEQDGGLVYVDLSSDPTLFQSRGDYQFDIYRHMKSHNRNNWKKFSPKTNVMWFHYLTTKLCCDPPELLASSSAASTCIKLHAICCKQLKDLELSTRKFKYKSAFDLVTTHKLFKNCRNFFSDK
uniref:non-specific serine/threonine protein kinase n=1 Tax=Trichobilharzia regenti TaxID=157069 RepID=A0AA85INT9_TRIRE|nr:unnamed protein product [Trichobilharzia regenti]